MSLHRIIASGLLCLLATLSLGSQITTKRAYAATDTSNFIELIPISPTDRAAQRNRVSAEVPNFLLYELDAETLAEQKAARPDRLQLTIPLGAHVLDLDLHRVNPLGAAFTLRTASGRATTRADLGVHYRGRVVGRPGCHVALSLLHGEMTAIITRPGGGNWVLGLLSPQRGEEEGQTYVLYQDEPIFNGQEFSCGTPDTHVPYTPEQLTRPSASGRSNGGNCVGVYFEVDHDIYEDKGDNAAAYVAAAFNEVAALFAASNVELYISEIFVWDVPSPYFGTSSSTLLTQFQQVRTFFNGDVGQLLSYQASGGIAVLSGLCHPLMEAKMSFSSIASTFQTVPTYSWTIMVIAHELGHLLGSLHTHACVWNGNGTAIDGCAGFTEGSCPNPGVPSGGGGVMSYCHLTSGGINFNNGMGDQPGAAIYNFVQSANCINGNGCGSPPPPPPTEDSCDQYTVILELTLDNFGMETTWTLETEGQDILASGGPYPKKLADSLLRDTFCLPEACYILRIFDNDGDGLCCQYGEGGYRLLGPGDEILATGGEFDSLEVVDFCLPDNDPPVTDECYLHFNEYTIQSYGGIQDMGTFAVTDNGRVLEVRDNAWKHIELPTQIEPNTILSFDFRSTIEGDIHAIGFDVDTEISPELTFQLYGTQEWGILDFATYAGDGEWQHFDIPVGEYLSGQSDYLFFAADHDLGNRDGNSFFRNVRVHTGQVCEENENLPGSGGLSVPNAVSISPNPVVDQLRLQTTTPGTYSVLSVTGHELQRGSTSGGRQEVNLSGLPTGTYLLRFLGADGTLQTRRFTRVR